MSILNALYPKSRFTLLSALLKAPMPIPLRQLARLTELSVRAVELNVDALTHQRIIRTKRVKNRLEIELNKSHRLFSELKELIESIENSERRENGEALNHRAKKALKFMIDGSELLARAKKR